MPDLATKFCFRPLLRFGLRTSYVWLSFLKKITLLIHIIIHTNGTIQKLLLASYIGKQKFQLANTPPPPPGSQMVAP